MQNLRAVLFPFVLTRLLLVGVGALQVVPPSPAPLGPAIPPGLVSAAHPSTGPIDDGRPALLRMWVQWDSHWLIDIATRGYRAPLAPDGGQGDAAPYDMRPNFFPAFPLVVAVVARAVGDEALSAVVVANAALLAALWWLHAWTARRVSPTVARRAVWLLCAFPTSFFLSAAYGESLLIAALTAAWWAAENRRWHLAGAALALAVIARPAGVFGVVLALGPIRDAWRAGVWKPGPVIAIVLWPALAAAAYLLFAAHTFGDPLMTVHTQADTRMPLQWPSTTVVRAWQEGLDWFDYSRSTLDALFALGALALLPFTFRLGLAEGMLACALVLFPLSSGLISFSRMLLPAFPLFVVMARLPGRWPWIGLTLASLFWQMLLFARFASGHWVA